MRLTIIPLISLIATACSGGSALNYPDDDPTGGGNVSIAYMKSLCTNRTYGITTDMTVSGTVAANDWLGEFYKSIVIVDDTGGLEVAIDGYRLYEDIPVFSKVTLFCNGMTLGRVGGKIELGAHPTGDFPVDGIDRSLISCYIRIDATGHKLQPVERRLNEITAADISSYICLRDVMIDGDRGNGLWCEQEDGESITTMRRIADRGGNTLVIRTDGRCIYASDPMPEGEFMVAGILDYSAGEYSLRIVNRTYSE